MNKRIIGSGGGGKDDGGGGRAPVEAPDTLRSIQYAKGLDAVSEGEIEGLVDGFKSVFLDDTPLQNADGTFNFSNVIIQQKTGTQSQSYMAGFDGAESENGVGTEVTQAASVTRTVTNTDATAVRVTLGFPSLNVRDITTGDLNGTSVEIAIDVQNNGGGFVPQILRNIYSSSVFSVASGVYTNTVDSAKFNFSVQWLGDFSTSRQTLTFELQYRLVGSGTWLTYTTSTFSGTKAVSSSGYNSLTGFVSDTSILLADSYANTGTKSFSVELPEGNYEFRVNKTNGTQSNQFTSLSGITYGGAVSITYAEAFVPAYTDVISGKCTSRYQRAYRIELPVGGEWDIRVRRITADSAVTTLQNKTFWDSYTEIVDAKLRYPNTAYFGFKIDSKNFSNIPVRGYEIYGIKVQIPSNYDPLSRVYTGTWDGTFTTAWTDNPAWIFYDIVTNSRYGLGDMIDATQVDKWSLYTIAQYCDEFVPDGFGGIEPRFTCNMYIQTREEAYRVVSNIASIFRGIAYWSAGEITVSQDAPSDAVQLFTQSNIVGGQFNYSGSSGKVRHTVVLVSWNDPQDGYRQKVEYVADDEAIARYGIVQTEIAAIGCTSRGQANRVGKWMIYSEINETETISFTAGLDTVFCGVGSVIKTQDPIRSGKRFGGRTLTGSTTTSIVIDSAVTIETAKTYELSVILPDGTIETKSVTNGVGSASTLTVSSAYSAIPLDYAIWVLAANDLVPESWRIVAMSEVEKSQIQITALAYDSRKYDAVEQDLILEPLQTSLLSASQPQQVDNLTVTETLYLSGLSVVATKAIVSWNSSVGANTYRLEYRLSDENPVIVNGINTNTYEIAPIQEGVYTFSVFAVNALGRRSQASTTTETIYGKTTPPNDVTDFNMVALSGYAHLTWAQSTDLDVLVGGHLRIRFTPELVTPTWDSSIDIGQQIPGNATNTVLPLMTGSYLAKWVDSTGNLSEIAVAVSSNVASLLTLNVVETVTESPAFNGTKTNVAYDAERGGIKLTPSSLVSEWALLSTLGNLSSIGGIASTGEYLFDGSVDLGTVQTSRLSVSIEVLSFDANDLISFRGLISTWGLVSGGNLSDVGVMVYIRTTNDNPLGSPVWSEWQQFFVGDWTARAYQFKVVLFSGDINHNVIVKTLAVTVDMPDRDDFGEDIVSGTSPYAVTYTTPFIAAPSLAITAQNMATGDYYEITSKTVTGFTIVFKNSGGTNVSRTFDYHAKGY
jgi:predicted phage tail protein